MKRITNLLLVLIFLLVLVVLFWMMPDTKIETIGDFFNKVTVPIAIPLSTAIITRFGIVEFKKYKHNKNDKSP